MDVVSQWIEQGHGWILALGHLLGLNGYQPVQVRIPVISASPRR
jgi:hypothetical protein